MFRVALVLLCLSCSCAFGYATEGRCVGFAFGNASITDTQNAEEMTGCAIRGGQLSEKGADAVGGLTGILSAVLGIF